MLLPSEKRKAFLIVIMSFFNAFLETLGVSAILPLVLALLQPSTLMSFPKVMKVVELFGVDSERGMVFFVGIMVVLVYVVKNTYIIFYNKYRLSFRNYLEKDLSVLMLGSYMKQSYTFFLNSNSGEIIRGVTSDNGAVVAALDNYCSLLNEMLTCVMIGIVLLMINPLMALAVLIIAGIIALLTVFVLKKKVAKYAVETREAFAERYKYVNETVSGIKEIDVMKRQNMFLKRFERASLKACENNTKYLWASMLPSRVIETVFLTGLIVIVLSVYKEGTDMTIIAAQFSALAVAAIRILPAISNISGAINGLVYNRPAFESAYNNIISSGNRRQLNDTDCNNENNTLKNNIFNEEIDVNSIYWKYSDRLPYVLSDVTFSIKKGEAIGIVGESGAGKSTLADILLGVLIPQKGTITVDGKSIHDEDTLWHKMVGYVPQNVFLIDDTIKNNILFGIDEKDADDRRLNDAIDKAQLRSFVDSQKDGIDTVLGERGVRISGGQRQRIAIARALYYDPDILVLDEATSALDNETENALIEAINALHGEKTLIIIAHRLTTIEKCDKVYEIKSGKAIRLR